MAAQQRDLQEGEDQRQWEAQKHLAGDPGLGREAAPHHLVDRRQNEEEQRPAHGELAPALVGQPKGRAEDRLQERAAEEQQAAAQDDAEQAVHDGRLELDEGVVLQPDREPAEHQHEETANQWHHRPALLQPAIAGQRHRGGGDEHAGADEDAPAAVGEKEQQQWSELERRRIEAARAAAFCPRLFAHAANPINPRAKARASNGRRSSIPSPTPIATTGNLNFSASATSTPPLALPSSLVTTSASTGDMVLKVSTWAWAFWPVVASSTSRQECGASGSSLRMTRTILASSSIRFALLCSRPAVSISSTSHFSARARSSAS